MPLHAVKARQGIMTVTQPDGTTLQVRLTGDETCHYYSTADGYPLVANGDTLCYAMPTDAGTLVTSGVPATDPALRSAATADMLKRIDRDAPVKFTATGSTTRRRSPRMRVDGSGRPAYGLFPGTEYPSKGNQKSLVILVEFSNIDFITPDANSYFTEMLNADGYNLNGATGSARQYFIDNSNGAFTPQFDVYGPVKLSQTMRYYGANDELGNDLRPHEMVIEACQLLDDEIDFTEYDRDGNGVIDNVFVFYAGRGEATGGGVNSIWPHSYFITKSDPGKIHKFDGLTLDSYACTNEWTDNHTCGIGTFCHEFTHVLGLPDLYSVHYNPAFTPGDWSLMDHGSYCNDEKTPSNLSVFERSALGWIEPRMITGDPEKLTLKPLDENDAAIIHAHDEGEYFLLENRQRRGWDAYLPGHGMLIWHIDYLERIWADNIVNDQTAHQYVDIEEADNIRTEATRSGDTFPGTAGVTEISDDTTPSLRPWSNRKLKIGITNIAETDNLITFNVNMPESGVESVAGDGSSITTDGLTLTVTSHEATACSVATPAGRVIYSATAATHTIELPAAGIYILTNGASSHKIAVR